MAITSHPCITGTGNGREAKQMLFLKGAPDVLVSYDDTDGDDWDDNDDRYDDDRDNDDAGDTNNDDRDDVDHDNYRDDDNNYRDGDERIVLYSWITFDFHLLRQPIDG